MKRTKWVEHDFSSKEKQARSFWRRAQEQENGLRDGLMVIEFPSREECHAKLDKRLDQIERLRRTAKDLFPEVDESFTVATDTIRF